jgi:hypothetical protein
MKLDTRAIRSTELSTIALALQGASESVRKFDQPLSHLCPIPIYSLPTLEQFVSDVERRQDGDAGRIDGRQLLGDLPHVPINLRREFLETLSVMVTTDSVHPTKDLESSRLWCALCHGVLAVPL